MVEFVESLETKVLLSAPVIGSPESNQLAPLTKL